MSIIEYICAVCNKDISKVKASLLGPLKYIEAPCPWCNKLTYHTFNRTVEE